MDFQNIVDSYGMAAAILSVEKTEDGHAGEIRIVRANAPYKQIMGNGYYDNMASIARNPAPKVILSSSEHFVKA